MRVGYVRVSSKTQKTARQDDLMKTLNVKKVYVDVMSGKSANRPQLEEMLSFLREGDELIVESISRLARNTKDLLELVQKLNEKGIKFISQKENLDTSTPAGKFMLTIFGAMFEMEREFILERQKEGIAAAKARGSKFGRPSSKYPENWVEIYLKWQDKKITATDAMKLLELKKTTFYKLVKRFESERGT